MIIFFIYSIKRNQIFCYFLKSLYKLRRNSGWDGRTVRNLSDYVWWRRTWVPSLGPTSVAGLNKTRLTDLSLCDDLPGVAPSVRSGSRSGSSSLSGGGSAGVALKPATRISGGERPRKQRNKIKRQGMFLHNKSGLFRATSYTAKIGIRRLAR